MTKLTSWEKMLQVEFLITGDDYSKIKCTLSEKELKEEFDRSFGNIEGNPFTAWGEKYVYFPICYDGAETVGKAPRHPCSIAMEHQGG